MSCPLTLQLTVSSIPVILSFFFPPHTSLNLTFYYYHHSPAPLSFLSLLFQGRCSDLRQTAASETGGWREDDRNDKRGSRVRPFHQLLFLSLLLCSTLGIFLLSSIHPTSFSAPFSLLKCYILVALTCKTDSACYLVLALWTGFMIVTWSLIFKT